MIDKPHISQTQLSMFWRCGEQYRRRYILGERRPPGIVLLIGSAYHKGAEVNFRQKIETHKDMKARDICDSAVAAFDERLDGEGIELTRDEAGEGVAVVTGRARDKTAQLARVYASEQAPDYQPAEVEVKTRILFPDASHDLLCITDLRDDCDRVVDLKTAAKKRPANSADLSLQLSVEAAAFMADQKRAPSELRLDTVTKGSKPQRQVLVTHRTRRDFEVLANRVNAMLLALEALNKSGDAFPMAAPDDWCCSIKWCGYAMTCPYYNAEREVS